MSGSRDLMFACASVALVLGLFCCTATALTATACEGEKVCLYCRKGLKLKVNDVRYGRENAYTCAATPAYSARCMKSVTNYVKPKCDGKDICSFSVSNTELGSDPCVNVYKYVVINYECVGSVTTTHGPPSVRTRVACEYQQLSMDCPAGQRVDIVRAVYGRGDSSTCRQGQFYSTSCGSDAKTALAATCRGRQSCSVTATNALTGVDPCPGTYKYLIVEFRCL